MNTSKDEVELRISAQIQREAYFENESRSDNSSCEVQKSDWKPSTLAQVQFMINFTLDKHEDKFLEWKVRKISYKTIGSIVEEK